MKLRILIPTICFLMLNIHAFAQQPIKADTLIKKLDSLAKKTDSSGTQVNNINKEAYNDVTKLNARNYFLLLGSNIKQEFTKPFHMKKRDFVRFGKFALATVALSFVDEPIQRNVLELRNRSSNIRTVGKYITNFGGVYEAVTLAAFGTYGIIAKSEKVKTTTLLATQAVVTGFLVEAVIKTITGRTRPNYYDQTVEAEPSFKGLFGNLSKAANGTSSNSSFPSGHTTAAFAAATIFAVEYKNKPYIPIIAYSIASLVGISRITENKHWATDVLAGAALGYLTGRQVAYNYHRFAHIKNLEEAKKKTVTLNMQYHFGKLMPGIVCKF